MIMVFKVLIPQPIHSIGVKYLEDNGISIVVPPKFDEDTLQNYIVDIDAIIARTENYSAKVLNSANRLKIIARHGIGLDNIDLETAKRKGIIVTNTPEANINAVAELV